MSWDSIWEKIFIEKEWGKYPAESVIRFVARNFYNKERKSVRILEIGCGPGANIWYLAREGFDAYGIEGSPTAIKNAKLRLQAEGLKGSLKVGDVVNLPYGDEYFDAVIDAECLSCNSVKNTKNILSEVKRVLKKDGLFYSRALADDMYVGKSQEKLSDFEYNNISDGPLGGRGFIRLIDKAGIDKLYNSFFKVLTIDKSGHTDNNGTINTSEWVIVCQKN